MIFIVLRITLFLKGLYLDEEDIAFLFAQIILPMHHIHSKNILHRDLKSQNIFLTKSKSFVKVSIFKNKTKTKNINSENIGMCFSIKAFRLYRLSPSDLF